MTKSIQVTESVHADLEFLKGHFKKKSMSDTIKQIMYHAGFRQSWFEVAERWKEVNLPDDGRENYPDRNIEDNALAESGE